MIDKSRYCARCGDIWCDDDCTAPTLTEKVIDKTVLYIVCTFWIATMCLLVWAPLEGLGLL